MHLDRRKWLALEALSAGLMLCLVMLAVVDEAGSQSARKGNFDVIRKQGDAFRNYDFRSERVSRRNVDWAIGLLFYNDAEINKVKGYGDFGNYYDQVGGPQYGRLKNNGGAYRWDSDRGRKSTLAPGCPSQPDDAFHYRIYATPDNDRMFNRRWGYYVFGSTHVDHNEACGKDETTYFGRSELAENKLSDVANRSFPRVLDDHASFGNGEPFRRQNNHVWFNNRFATYIYVP